MSNPEEFSPEQETAAAHRLFSPKGWKGFSELMVRLHEEGLDVQADELSTRYDNVFMDSLHLLTDYQEEGDHK